MSQKISPIPNSFDNLCQEAGYYDPTILQQRICGMFQKSSGQDTVYQAGPEDGAAIAALLAALILQKKSTAANETGSKQTLILTSFSGLLKAHAFCSGLKQKEAFKHTPVVIGLTKDAKEDLPFLQKQAGILISSPERLIDHLRRDNLAIHGIRQVFIVDPQLEEQKASSASGTTGNTLLEVTESFYKDLLFIFSKFQKHPVTKLFAPYQTLQDHTSGFLNRPGFVSISDWSQISAKTEIRILDFLTPSQIVESIVSDLQSNLLIFCKDQQQRSAIQSRIDKLGPFITASLFTPEDVLPRITTMVDICVAGQETEEAIRNTLVTLCSHAKVNRCLFLIEAANPNYNATHIQERYPMSSMKHDNPTSEEFEAGKIRLLLEQVKLDKDPDELHRLKKVIRKQIPLRFRSYLYAYLLREALQLEKPQQSRKPRTQKSSGVETRKEKPVKTSFTGDENTATLFVSTGKSRRVFAKDLIQFFSEGLGISESDIQHIKVLANYSFVSVSKPIAEQAIEKLHGTKFRGRAITISYAKKRPE